MLYSQQQCQVFIHFGFAIRKKSKKTGVQACFLPGTKLAYINVNIIAGGRQMKTLKEKNEIAKLLKVSLSTLNVYLKTKKGVIVNGLVDKRKLYEYINK